MGVLQQVNAEQFNTALAATDVGLATYGDRALQTLAQDELRSRIHDSAGTQINPDQSPDYPDSQTVGYDLIGTGDLVIGPVSVARAEAVVISVNSTDAATFSVSVDWEDGAGNVFQAESAADIGMANVTQDWARLVRKGPQVEVTITDTSGGVANNVNAHVDVER